MGFSWSTQIQVIGEIQYWYYQFCADCFHPATRWFSRLDSRPVGALESLHDFSRDLAHIDLVAPLLEAASSCVFFRTLPPFWPANLYSPPVSSTAVSDQGNA
ncbi:hypothetical protein [Castellaniella sp.]|uniref:hypothetical protein n=1 Tax=Castellaniella sp. TaxID=1955812 RepID=UPI003C760FD8